MDYLNSTIIFLQKQNRDLKEGLRRMRNIVEIVQKERQTEQKDFISRMHQEQINVIRQIAQENQKSLKIQITRLNQENNQINKTLEIELDRAANLKLQLQAAKDLNQNAEKQKQNLNKLILLKEYRIIQMQKDYRIQYQRLQDQYITRQNQVIQRYMQKVEELRDNNQIQVHSKDNLIKLLQSKLDNCNQQKYTLEQELNRMKITLKEQQKSKANRNQNYQNQIFFYRSKNQQMKMALIQRNSQIQQLKLTMKEEQTLRINLEVKFKQMSKKYKQLLTTKSKQIQKQRYKARSMCQDLSNHNRYLKQQINRQKQKQKDFNKCKKTLINKIKQIQNRADESNISLLSNITAKSTTTKKCQNMQSMSLNNSFIKNKQNPTVSCFLKDDQSSPALSLAKKNNLKIQTDSCMFDLVRMKDIETPCFESSRDKKIKKTIKIRK